MSLATAPGILLPEPARKKTSATQELQASASACRGILEQSSERETTRLRRSLASSSLASTHAQLHQCQPTLMPAPPNQGQQQYADGDGCHPRPKTVHAALT